jgi:hypothetical protein
MLKQQQQQQQQQQQSKMYTRGALQALAGKNSAMHCTGGINLTYTYNLE